MDRLASLTYQSFAPLVGDTFEVRTTPGAVVELVLVDAAEGNLAGGAGQDGPPRTQFSIVFHGDVGTPIAQGTYSFSHKGLGEFALFIVPIGVDADGMQYEAVFG